MDSYGYERVSLAAKLKELCALHVPVLEGEDDVDRRVFSHIEDLFPAWEGNALLALERQVCSMFHEIPPTEGKNRRLLQVVGTDIIRAHDPDVWVDYIIRQTRDLDHVVVDDMRFVNELERLQQAGWFMVYCAVPNAIRARRLEADYGRPLTAEERNHPSERSLDQIPATAWDYVLNTAGSMVSERTQVDEMFDYLMEVAADVEGVPAGASGT